MLPFLLILSCRWLIRDFVKTRRLDRNTGKRFRGNRSYNAQSRVIIRTSSFLFCANHEERERGGNMLLKFHTPRGSGDCGRLIRYNYSTFTWPSKDIKLKLLNGHVHVQEISYGMGHESLYLKKSHMCGEMTVRT